MTIGNAGLAARVERENTTRLLKRFLSRYFYLCMALVTAGVVVWGFGKTVDGVLFHANPPRPMLLSIHAAVFSLWVAFFIVQSALVRARKVNIHRFLGWFGAGLATVMVGLGFAIAVVMTRFNMVVLHETDADSFLSITFGGISAFGMCVTLAIYWRMRPEYHRRLIFIASCTLLDAPLDRFDFIFYNNLGYPVLDLLIVLGVVRDWVVDRRVHKVYLYALPLLIIWQSLSISLWKLNPRWWQATTQMILG